MGLYIFCLYRPEMPTGETLTRQLLSVIHVLQVAELVQQNLTVAAQDTGEISISSRFDQFPTKNWTVRGPCRSRNAPETMPKPVQQQLIFLCKFYLVS